MQTPRIAPLVVGAALLLVPLSGPGATARPGGCPAPPPMRFAPQTFVDETRAGGEPMIATHPDGSLLYSAHAGTTHFYSPSAPEEKTSAFASNYNGQTYIWRSGDNGSTWTYVPRPTPDNLPLQGFSDPDFAIDTEGNVFFSEINLVNVAMSRSGDAGKSYRLKNFFAQVLTDRQWSEADTKDLVYLVGNASFGGTSPTKPVGNNGHYLYRSTDGGATFTAGVRDPGGLGDLRVDKRTGTLFEAHYSDGVLSVVAFRKARAGDLTPSESVVARDVRMIAHWPAIDVDDEGNVYIVWDQSGQYPQSGIWFAASKDQGKTWSKPVRVNKGDTTAIWPWLAVGDPGRVGIGWFEAPRRLPSNNPETKGTHAWRVMAAQTLSGLGCEVSQVPTFTVSVATPRPVHTGTICNGGTTCQAMAIDRRLGDYMSVEIDATGAFVAAYSDTRRGGAVSLPGFVRQVGGASFFEQSSNGTTKVLGRRTGGRALPSTGVGGGAVAGALLIMGAALVRRGMIRAR